MATTMPRTNERLREITVNGRSTRTGADTLAGLVAEQGFGAVRVATAVNGDFVPESKRAAARLHDGDSIEILSVRQGG